MSSDDELRAIALDEAPYGWSQEGAQPAAPARVHCATSHTMRMDRAAFSSDRSGRRSGPPVTAFPSPFTSRSAIPRRADRRLLRPVGRRADRRLLRPVDRRVGWRAGWPGLRVDRRAGRPGLQADRRLPRRVGRRAGRPGSRTAAGSLLMPRLVEKLPVANSQGVPEALIPCRFVAKHGGIQRPGAVQDGTKLRVTPRWDV
jgi:hypothetical protein